MTYEELAEEYAEGHSPSFKEFPKAPRGDLKQAFLAGLKAGKEITTRWHKVADRDLPKEKKLYLATTKEGSLILAYYNGTYWETKYDMSANGHAVEVILAWCELPIFKEM